MPVQRRHGHFTLGCLGLVMALLLVLPVGVAADATPVGVGSPVQFAGNGFTPNDSLAFWETGPDNNPIPLGGAQSDGSGGFNFTVTFPSAGNWQVTAHSITSGKEISGSYAVGSTTTSSAPVPSGVLPAGTLQSAIGAPITFSGTGFTALEQISLWETAPDSTVTGLTGTQADGTGAFSVSVSFTTAGQWQVTAHGISSAKQITGAFAVGSTSIAASPATTSVAPAASTTLPPGTLPAGVGSPVTFSSSGFTANERISLWETSPESTVIQLPGTGTDNGGGFSVSITFPTAGLWQVTAHGVTSLKEVVGRYSVGTPGVAGTATTFNGQGFSTVPPVALGTPVTFSGSGFNGSEDIKLWETSPGSVVTPLADVGADGLGNFTATVTFPDVGNWQVTAHGRDSLREVIGRYTVTSDGTGTTSSPVTSTTVVNSSAVAATTGSIVNTTVSTTIGFMPSGFTAGELVSVWSTGPDGSVTNLDSTQASSIGQVTVTASFASSGLWQITVHGRTSGHEVVGRYQVANRT